MTPQEKTDNPRVPVTSEVIKAVGYEPTSKILEIEFKNGAIWHYEDVEEEKHKQLMFSQSIGRFFHSKIKNLHKARKIFDGKKSS